MKHKYRYIVLTILFVSLITGTVILNVSEENKELIEIPTIKPNDDEIKDIEHDDIKLKYPVIKYDVDDIIKIDGVN